MPPLRKLSSFWQSIAFINASYTLIAGLTAPTAGVFTSAGGRWLVRRQGHQLQIRDNHQDPPRLLFF
jgi:hypothetical protein